MTIESALGLEDFDPSKVRSGIIDVSALDDEQKEEAAAYCESMMERWEAVRASVKECWTMQEHLKRMLAVDMADDRTANQAGALILGSTSLFAGAYATATGRIAELKGLRDEILRFEPE